MNPVGCTYLFHAVKNLFRGRTAWYRWQCKNTALMFSLFAIAGPSRAKPAPSPNG